VEGGDLTVRDGRVFLKTLGGLHPVDVILRRLNDDWCDPLELRPESLLGVPGLLQAARDGQVAIANALGAGVAQTPALTPFLPSLCRALLGEGLTTVAVKTGLGAASARQIPPVRARAMIEDGAKRALSDLCAVEPWSPGSPCEITVEFKHTYAPDKLRFRVGVERVGDRTISVRADTWWEAWQRFYF